jgi:hypothetical protein
MSLLLISLPFLFFMLLVYYIWYPAFLHLVFSYNLLIQKSQNIIKVLWISLFFWFFLAPCALLTNDRLHPSLWLLIFLFIKNLAHYTESFAIELIGLLYVYLLFEHLFFAFVCYSSETVRNFFTNIFGAELLFFCLGNMWRAPATKLGVAAGAVGYDVVVSALSEKAGTLAANESLTQFPNQTLQDYTRERNQIADKYYNRYSVCGNFGTFISKIFK